MKYIAFVCVMVLLSGCARHVVHHRIIIARPVRHVEKISTCIHYRRALGETIIVTPGKSKSPSRIMLADAGDFEILRVNCQLDVD